MRAALAPAGTAVSGARVGVGEGARCRCGPARSCRDLAREGKQQDGERGEAARSEPRELDLLDRLLRVAAAVGGGVVRDGEDEVEEGEDAERGGGLEGGERLLIMGRYGAVWGDVGR